MTQGLQNSGFFLYYNQEVNMSAQHDWKHNCNQIQRRNNKQFIDINDEDDTKQVRHYGKTRYGDLWGSPHDGYNYKRGKGHDKRKPWRD